MIKFVIAGSFYLVWLPGMKVPVTLDWAGLCALGGLLIHRWMPSCVFTVAKICDSSGFLGGLLVCG